MAESFVMQSTRGYDPEPQEPIMTSLFKQYERVIVESLISAFALDFLVKDQHGGDVDTIHNVRQIGTDDEMTYKNVLNEQAYANRGAYDSHEYHSDPRYIASNREIKRQKEAGTLVDGYTGKKLGIHDKTDQDHILSAHKIHEDPGRVLADLSGTDLANSQENLLATNQHLNRIKKDLEIPELLEKHGDEFTAAEKKRMLAQYEKAKKSYEKKLTQAYYTSPKFAKDTALAAGKVGAKMGLRQALGFAFAEIWFAVKEEFAKIKGHLDIGEFVKSLGDGIKRGYENIKAKYTELWDHFLNGAVAGALSSITTTICNIFFTTAKNIVRVIRQCWASLVEAAKVLFINPQNYAFGERIRVVAKILATGASVVVGTLVSEAVDKACAGIPVLSEVVPAFCGAFVSGILSCTLLVVLDRNELINKLVHTLDNMPSMSNAVNYFREQADYFERYAAELMQIDLETFRRETALYNSLADELENAQSESELNRILLQGYENLCIALPWEGYSSFDDFMSDPNARLVFK